MTPRPIERLENMPGRESAWQYPRPPRVEASQRHIVVVFAGEVVAETRRALRVVERSHPPVYYVPPGDYGDALLRPTPHESFCEFKGVARFYDIVVGERVAH